MKVPRSPVFFFSVTLAAFSIALVAFVVLIFLSQRSVERATEWVNVTLEVKEHLGRLRTNMAAAQGGQVTTLLTGDQRHLTQYYKATTDIGLTLRSLSILVASVPVQTQRVEELKVLFREKIREMDGTVQTVRSGDHQGALQAARDNASTSLRNEKIDRVLQAASETATAIGRKRQAVLQASERKRGLISFGLVFALAGLMVGLFVAVRRARRYERLIKVCAWSKTVQYQGEWVSYEEYLQRRFNVSVSHGISPEAMAKLDADG